MPDFQTISKMTSLSFFFLLFLLSLCAVSFSLPFYSKRELAPSLTLHRINALKDTIDQLNDIKKAMRCREKGDPFFAIKSHFLFFQLRNSLQNDQSE